MLARNHGPRYYDWRSDNGAFRSSSIRSTSAATGLCGQGAQPIRRRRRAAKQLSEVERAFADLKDVLGMRPIHHQTDNTAC